ncbi:hypothetical protein ACNKHW_11455 [Shigella flexneri]
MIWPCRRVRQCFQWVEIGEVVVAKRSGAAGYYVAIRHGRSYTTRLYALAQDSGETGTEGETWRPSRFPVMPDVNRAASAL